MAAPPTALLKTVKVLDTFSDWSGKLIAWLIIPLVLSGTYEVIARYGFDSPTTWAYDTSYMLYGTLFMLGAGYTLLKGAHIRTDFFYEHWSTRTKGLVDAFCYLFLFFPGMFFFLLAGWDAAAHSWSIRETSEASAWRPYIYPFKTVMPVTAVLVLIQGVSEFLKAAWAAKTGTRP
jgi:TRAP-type mannitol/chloroaromatic compound transport system permease small subunit